ncbi:MAG: ATP-dependent DNA helicase RecG [Nocardioides sp.]
MMAITPETPVESVLGAARQAARFREGLGLETVGDLLRHFPRRYLNTATLTRLDRLVEGDLLTFVGQTGEPSVRSYTERRTGRSAFRVEVPVHADGAVLGLTFFSKHQRAAQWQATRLSEGTKGIFLGKASRFRGNWQLSHPQMVLFGDSAQDEADASLTIEDLRDLFPIYPLTKGLESWDVMRAVRSARELVEGLEDPLPEQLRDDFDLIGLRLAYDWIHAPDNYAQVTKAQRRFRFAEALTLQLVLGRRRRALAARGAKIRDGGSGALATAFDTSLPFDLTTGQRSIGEVIAADLARPVPMNRLLQGEVGSGKTIVALRAMLRVVDSGGQAALLAPTEVLAQQHYRSISGMLGDLGIAGQFGAAQDATGVELLTGSMTKAQRTEPLLRIATGEAGIVIGTHALLTDQVSFADLGLVVVDEQHRFGVEQRAALTDKADDPPHVLVMTATPIPRTVAMTVFGDLEVSTLTELPAGRAPVQTNVVPLADRPGWHQRIWERVSEEVAKGHQVYVVCPRISGGETETDQPDAVDYDADGQVVAPPASLTTVTEAHAMLVDGPLEHLRVAMLHGRMAPDIKERTMRDFAAGSIDVLVATTVIEVGVDVHNATMMVLLDADRFGISQLHQLRGRVGRGGLPGLCLLVTNAEDGSPARERLAAVASTTDGFALSQIDLELRREGDVLGASQSGYRSSLENLRVLRDEKTIVEARAAAAALLDNDVRLGDTPLLAAEVARIEAGAEADFMEKS